MRGDYLWSECMSTAKARRRSRSQAKSRHLFGSPWLWLGLGIVLIAGGLAVYALGGQTGPALTTSASASDGFLPSLRTVLDESAGQVRLVNFWATWCPPCRAELPDLVGYYHDHADEGFLLVGVNSQESALQVSAFLTQQGLDFPVVLDQDGSQAAPYGISGLPSSFLIGPDGEILQQWTGMISRTTLEQAVTPLLGS
jgi:cytochrome c biogenesis protein CcmG/thiol:disulfide interchange protein DsbE